MPKEKKVDVFATPISASSTQGGASIPEQTSLMSPFDTFDCAADLRILVDISLKSLKLLQSSNLHCLKRSKYTAQWSRSCFLVFAGKLRKLWEIPSSLCWDSFIIDSWRFSDIVVRLFVSTFLNQSVRQQSKLCNIKAIKYYPLESCQEFKHPMRKYILKYIIYV